MSSRQQSLQEAMMNISQALPLVFFLLPAFSPPPFSLTHVPLSVSLPPSLSLPAASLRAWQGHGAVSYYKRSSPSLLQETQTHQSPVPPPPPPPPPCSSSSSCTTNNTLITHSASGPFALRRPRRHTHTHARSGQTQNSKTLNFFFLPSFPSP